MKNGFVFEVVANLQRGESLPTSQVDQVIFVEEYTYAAVEEKFIKWTAHENKTRKMKEQNEPINIDIKSIKFLYETVY
ncbi:hypothetical protein BKP45_15080 [Anaerobacillus alkalidiazotrophicus]|uniref:Uncharacterized protein n=1 Tax=Anaerobacillus alkalidiazotrophicus TaxID=472963 RepID=A0A1S2M286_9BACI|nr:hypothetical protein [Anaerobacillus alkalidiazotrophicus]OIJ18851.1 hypothetical protein BKP45_15080 [Anaerobacillus alkalidiazotrophicus]